MYFKFFPVGLCLRCAINILIQNKHNIYLSYVSSFLWSLIALGSVGKLEANKLPFGPKMVPNNNFPDDHSISGYHMHLKQLMISNVEASLHSEGYVDRLEQERCNSIANALELRLSCMNTLMWTPILLCLSVCTMVRFWMCCESLSGYRNYLSVCVC